MMKDGNSTQLDQIFIGNWIVRSNGEVSLVHIVADGQYLVTQHYPSVALNPTHLTLNNNSGSGGVFTRKKGGGGRFIGEWESIDKISYLIFKSNQTYTWTSTDGEIKKGIFVSTIAPLFLTLHTHKATLTTKGNHLTITQLNNSKSEYYYQIGQNSILLFNREDGKLEQILNRA